MFHVDEPNIPDIIKFSQKREVQISDYGHECHDVGQFC